MARPRDALVVRGRSRTSRRSWSAWQTRTRLGATRASAVGSRVSVVTSPAIRSRRSSRTTASSPHRSVARRRPGRRSLPRTGTALQRRTLFTVEVLTLRGLVRYVVFFVMKLKTRTVEIAGITCQPDEVWMTQVARNLTAAGDGFLRGMPYVILDRDPRHDGLPAPAAKQWREAPDPPGVESEFERVCGTLCRIRQVGLFRPTGAARRRTSPRSPSEKCSTGS
jgi:hypothetical protein